MTKVLFEDHAVMVSLCFVWIKSGDRPPVRLGCMLVFIYRYSNHALATTGNESAFCHGTPCRCEELYAQPASRARCQCVACSIPHLLEATWESR